MLQLIRSRLGSTSVATLRGLAELRALGGSWHDLCRRCRGASAFQTPAWATSWCEAFRPTALHALAARQRGELVGLALLRPAAGGGLTFIGAPLNDENAILLDSAADPAEILAAMLQHLSGEGRFRRILASPSESLASVLHARHGSLPEGWRVSDGEPEPAARMALPSSWDLYLESLPGSRRRRARYALSHAEREWNASLVVERAPYVPRADVDALLDLREASMRLRDLWEPCLPAAKGRRFAALVHRLFQVPAEASGDAVSYLAKLAHGGRVVAAGLYLRFHGTMMKYCHGWAPELQHSSPGTVLDLKMMAWCIEQGIETFDFGRGDEPYKERLGASPVQLPSLVLQSQLGPLPAGLMEG